MIRADDLVGAARAARGSKECEDCEKGRGLDFASLIVESGRVVLKYCECQNLRGSLVVNRKS